MDEAKKPPGDAGRSAELQQQMDQIGDRFIQRLLAELAMMRELIADLKAGEPSGLKDLELFAHRIHGSSAMFGFNELADLAGELERTVSHEQRAGGQIDLAAVERGFGLLETASRAAASVRNGR